MALWKLYLDDAQYGSFGYDGHYRRFGSPRSALKVLPNLDIVATGDLPAADRLTLSAYAEQTGDRVWTVSSASLLTTIDIGRSPAEFRDFLAHRAEHELPETLPP